MKKLLVIDGNSILNRAFFGIRTLTNRSGRFTNAVYGLVNVLYRELTELEPDYAAIAFDLHEPTFRKKMYEPYKANRHGMPDELRAQLDDAKFCAEHMGLHRLELPGYEADDILGTVSAFTESNPDLTVYILSGDRDLLQLISPRVCVLLAGNTETAKMDRDSFFARYGIEPEQFVDVKALMGDSSDNIPGVPGVGEKTALRLIAAHASLDGVYDHIDAPDITKGLRTKLEEGRNSAYLSQKLATILRDAPIGKTLADLTYHGMDKAALCEKFTELEFISLIRKFGLDTPDPATPDGTAEEDVTYTPATAEELCKTQGDLALCIADDTLYFHTNEKNLSYTGDWRAVAPLFDGSRHLIVYDAKALYHLCRAHGVTPGGVPFDVMLAAYDLDAANGAPSPESLFTAYLGKVPPAGKPYAHDLPALADALNAKVEENGVGALLRETELPLAMLLARMEETGFKIDRAGLSDFRTQLERAMEILEGRIHAAAGEVFNLNSPKQLGVILFEKLGLPSEKKTKTKSGYSTDVEVLNRLRPYHPIVGDILDYRQIAKLYATYAVGLLRVADEQDCVHTDFKQALTATGRLSSAEPNLQNIPIRTELGREMRRFFIPRAPGRLLVDADYSQIELRLLAHMSGDENMIAAFRAGADIHRSTAAAVFGMAPEDVTDELRGRAKAVNFGIVYGISAFSLAGDLGISTARAKAYMDAYFSSYPGVAAYMEKVVADAYENGYVCTLYGHRRSIPELRVQNKNTRKFGERVAMNSPIQGTAADIMKIAMLRVDSRLRQEGLDALLVMQVHDELIVDAAEEAVPRVAEILREEMEGAASLSVPLTVDVTVSRTWLE